MQSEKDIDLDDETLTLRENETLIIYIEISCNERLINTEAMRGPGSIPTGGNIMSLDFFCFHVVKLLMPIMVLLPTFLITKNLSSDGQVISILVA